MTTDTSTTTETFTFKWNPFAVIPHNGWRLPRILFHYSHVLVGVPAALLAWVLLHGIPLPVHPASPHLVPFVAVVAATFGVILACLDKMVWVKWGWIGHEGETGSALGRGLRYLVATRLRLHSMHPQDWPDFWSDMGLTIVGAFAFTWWGTLAGWGWALVAVLVLSTFNGE